MEGSNEFCSKIYLFDINLNVILPILPCKFILFYFWCQVVPENGIFRPSPRYRYCSTLTKKTAENTIQSKPKLYVFRVPFYDNKSTPILWPIFITKLTTEIAFQHETEFSGQLCFLLKADSYQVISLRKRNRLTANQI